jgi:hypothetical protein
MKSPSYFLLLVIISFTTICQANFDSSVKRYNDSYHLIEALLKNNSSFAKAVYITENTFWPLLTEEEFVGYISALSKLAGISRTFYQTKNYHYRDSNNYLLNRSVLKVLCDSTHIKGGSSAITLLPYTYNFQDPSGKADWTNMFVTKSLITQRGNCRSLAYLYKILADELGARCWLALAPGHIYIRNYSEKTGWYNTELTSGTFPTDAWMAASGYVSADAIRSGIYMDTLSNQQSIALCVLDLAKGYEIQTHNYYDGFILKCCELVLQYHAVNPMALLLKAETLKGVYLKQQKEKDPMASATHDAMDSTYITLVKLHYREMPEKMYQEWLKGLSSHQEKPPIKRQPGTKIVKPSTK